MILKSRLYTESGFFYLEQFTIKTKTTRTCLF